MATNNRKEQACQIIKSGDTERVKAMIAQGYPLNELDSSGYAPLHYATRKMPTTVKILQLLLDNGANINIRSGGLSDWNTPLMEAIENKCEEAIYCLLANNADPNITDRHKQTALDVYCSEEPVDITTVSLFLGRGAKTDSLEGRKWVGKLDILQGNWHIRYLQMRVTALENQVKEMRQLLQLHFDYMPHGTHYNDAEKDFEELRGK